MTDTVFRTGIFTKQLRLYMRNRKRSVTREELYEVFGSDYKTRKKIYAAISNLISQGHVHRDGKGSFRYADDAPIPGEKADRVWEYWRNNSSFTASECALYTGLTREYIQSLIRLYAAKGYVEQVAQHYGNTELRRYRLKDKSLLIRPSSEK